MQALLARARDLNLGALLGVSAIFFGLLAGGSNSASGAALLAAMLCALACLTIALSPLAASRRLLAQNWISLAAMGALVVLVIASIAPLSGAMGLLAPHPLWEAIGLETRTASISPYRSIEGLVAMLAPLGAFILGALTSSDSRRRDWAGRWLVCWSLLYASFGLYLYFSAQAGPGGRLDVAISSANAAATVFGILIIVAAALVMRGARGRLDRSSTRPPTGLTTFLTAAPLSLAAALVLFGCILLTASRGGLIAFGAGALVFALVALSQAFSRANLRWSLIAAPVAAVFVLFLVLFIRGGDEVIARFALASEDAEARRIMAEAHWQAFLERPLFGHGLNTYHELNALAATPENWRMLGSSGSVHNIYIQTLEEVGVVGLALFALMLAPLLVRAVARIAKRGSGAEWAAAALAITALVLLHGLVDFGLQVPAIAALYAFILGTSLTASPRQA